MRKVYKRQPRNVIDAIRKDRADGMGLTDLVRKHNMSKTGIWHHVRDIDLSDEVRRAIRAYRGGSKAEKLRQWEKAELQGISILKGVDIEKSWAVLYAALYWSEGTKGSFVFTNTDARMIKVFLKIARNHLGIKDNEWDIMIRTCTPMDQEKCRAHWARVTELPISQIRINHHDRHNKSTTEFGMCRMTLRRGAYHLKLVHCLFKGIADKMLASLP